MARKSCYPSGSIPRWVWRWPEPERKKRAPCLLLVKIPARQRRISSVRNALGVETLSKFWRWNSSPKLRQKGVRFRRMFNESRKGLADVAADRPAQPSTTIGQIQEKPLHGTPAQTHAKIVLAIAMRRYGLVGADDIGKVVKAIQADGDFLGLSVDHKVIRSLLKKGTFGTCLDVQSRPMRFDTSAWPSNQWRTKARLRGERHRAPADQAQPPMEPRRSENSPGDCFPAWRPVRADEPQDQGRDCQALRLRQS